jgi:hypothetical protein
MEDVLGLFVGLLVVLVSGFGVRPILGRITRPEQPPQGVEEDVWRRIVGRGAEPPNPFPRSVRDARRWLRDEMRSRDGAEWLGRVERLLSFGIFWLGAYEVLVAWLAFKVASKWEAWSNVVKVPGQLPKNVDETDYFRARSQLGSWLFTRFVLGTLLNVLIGLVGVAVGRKALDAL